MKDCCDNYIHNSQPKRPRPDLEFFSEVHTCPICGKKMRIHFQTVISDEEIEFVPLHADPA